MGTYFTDLTDGELDNADTFNSPLDELDGQMVTNVTNISTNTSNIATLTSRLDGTAYYTPSFAAVTINTAALAYRPIFWRTGGANRFEQGLDNTDTNIYFTGWTGSVGAETTSGTPLMLGRTNNTVTTGILAHTGSSLGFYSTTPAVKQTVLGSRGADTAGTLLSLLTALSTIGILTDGTIA